jgi:hypothetical protein
MNYAGHCRKANEGNSVLNAARVEPHVRGQLDKRRACLTNSERTGRLDEKALLDELPRSKLRGTDPEGIRGSPALERVFLANEPYFFLGLSAPACLSPPLSRAGRVAFSRKPTCRCILLPVSCTLSRLCFLLVSRKSCRAYIHTSGTWTFPSLV